MTAPLSKDELTKLSVECSVQAEQAAVRAQWIAKLRAEGRRQCVGLHKDFDVQLRGRDAIVTVHRPVHVCAMALLGEITHGRHWWKDRRIRLGAIGAKAGLTIRQTQTVVAMNDGGSCDRTGGHMPVHTFAQIADHVEAWFLPK